MCWADRLGIVWLGLWGAFFWLIHNPEAHNTSSGNEAIVIFLFGPWAVLRFIDLVFAGPARRKGKQPT